MTYDPNAPSQPYGQPSAAPYGQPMSQQSAGYGAPVSQPSAGYAPMGDPNAMQYGNEVTQQLPMQPQQEYTGQIPQGPYGPEQTGPVPMQQGPVGAPNGSSPQMAKGPSGSGPFAFLGDLGFQRIHAPSIAKLAFLLISLGLLANWLGGVYTSLMTAVNSTGRDYIDPTQAWLRFVADLLLGWIMPLGTIMLLRIGIEWAVNGLRKIQQDRT